MYHDETILLMQKLLTQAFSPTHLEITNDSHRHIGHAGAQSGGGHFTVTISANVFQGKKLLACHRLIYAALGDLMQKKIHALKIRVC
jgi:BolA protein